MIQSDNINFRGLYSYCGNSYSTDLKKVSNVRNESINLLLEVVNYLQAAGIECPDVGIGSTPSCSLQTQPEIGKLTEMHPGNYIFYGNK